MKLNASSSSSQNNSCCDDMEVKGLVVWREALHKVHTAAQLAMVQHALEASIAWDKSIMKAVSPPQNAQTVGNLMFLLQNCQFCHSGDNEDKLLLCDGCDKGYHTYCFRPKMETIPDGDWYCHQCLNQAKGEKNCIVPRGKWYCSNCVSKHPKKKSTRRSQSTTMPLTPTTTTTTTTTSPIKTTDESTTNSTESIPIRLNKELAPCRQVLDDLESHDEAWPFLLAVNTKQFPTYRKVIRNPMDLQTIGKRLSQNEYKSRDEFVSDVRLIFDNCETFNEDNSPVGKAGHTLRLFFETRWADLTSGKSQV
ncbi:hypothetical protein AAG570_010266 [Ranatra chinensis]|uniref:Bromodomain adjacent to zinc finger domain protein 2B n=1 Tax=Ranatra chinensis TaxID=642074 RepID=A0ABD0YMA3_9HEMI